jgi:hypothetical protein
VTFYVKGKSYFKSSLCFRCSNIRSGVMMPPGAGFQNGVEEAKQLRKFFDEIWSK